TTVKMTTSTRRPASLCCTNGVAISNATSAPRNQAAECCSRPARKFRGDLAVLTICLAEILFRHFRLISHSRGDRRPFFQHFESDGQQRRSEKHTNETKRQRAAHHAKENQNERHVASLADEPRFDDVVNVADAHAPDQHENTPARP